MMLTLWENVSTYTNYFDDLTVLFNHPEHYIHPNDIPKDGLQTTNAMCKVLYIKILYSKLKYMNEAKHIIYNDLEYRYLAYVFLAYCKRLWLMGDKISVEVYLRGLSTLSEEGNIITEKTVNQFEYAVKQSLLTIELQSPNVEFVELKEHLVRASYRYYVEPEHSHLPDHLYDKDEKKLKAHIEIGEERNEPVLTMKTLFPGYIVNGGFSGKFTINKLTSSLFYKFHIYLKNLTR